MKKTHVERFLEECSDEQIVCLLMFTKAQLQDRLEATMEQEQENGLVQ